jgi:hypothetical protein
MANYWEPVEREWRERFDKELQPLLDLTADAHAFVATLAQHPDLVAGEESDQLVVQRLLLRRLGEELRGVELLALNGHGYQAISAAANLFEQYHCLSSVTQDESNAREFLAWTNSRHLPMNVKQTVNLSGQIRGWSDERSGEEYNGKYRLLCLFKHNNPLVFRLLSMPGDPDLFLGRLALSESLWFALSSVGIVAVLRLNGLNAIEAISSCNAMMDRVTALTPEFPEDALRGSDKTS